MMIETVKSALESVDGLQGSVYPASVVIDSVAAPFAVYTFSGRLPTKDLGGQLHHYTETVLVDFWAETYDEVHRLYCDAEEALSALEQTDDGNGSWIYGITCANNTPDSSITELGRQMRRMSITIRWSPLT